MAEQMELDRMIHAIRRAVRFREGSSSLFQEHLIRLGLQPPKAPPWQGEAILLRSSWNSQQVMIRQNTSLATNTFTFNQESAKFGRTANHSTVGSDPGMLAELIQTHKCLEVDFKPQPQKWEATEPPLSYRVAHKSP